MMFTQRVSLPFVRRALGRFGAREVVEEGWIGRRDDVTEVANVPAHHPGPETEHQAEGSEEKRPRQNRVRLVDALPRDHTGRKSLQNNGMRNEKKELGS